MTDKDMIMFLLGFYLAKGTSHNLKAHLTRLGITDECLIQECIDSVNNKLITKAT